MIGRYVWRDLRRNPRRSLTALAGMTLGIGLFSAVLFFIDGSSATMTARRLHPFLSTCSGSCPIHWAIRCA